MSILIKGMEMPIKCGICPCFHAEWPMYCQAVKADKNKRIVAPYGMPRPEWCPLVELPPHGRLIDADELKKFPIRRDHYDKEHGDEHFINGIETVMEFIDYAPTIIEAKPPKEE